ncbi:MAG: M12 family metallo-peptidase, partial [Planctomycetaceae bacterium]|nr:M12 family metallo-peptidase [Planctomycetaceae bacterium]
AGFGTLQAGVRPVVELAVDMDYDMRANFASNEAATEYTGALVGAVSAIYRRDVGASVQLVYLRIYNDPADLFNEPDPLGPFRDYWESAGGKVDRDLFTLFTGRRNLPYGGVAWLSAACGSFGYSVNGYLNGVFADPVATNPGNWDINVVAHELGHNVGTLHTHDYSLDGCASGTVQRGTIMSYCHVVSGASSNIDLRFHRGTAVPIESFMAGAACLASDCNGNGIEDADEITASPALDGNGDQILDACQDCDANGVPDPVQIASGALADADGDGRPDSCETDCDANGTADSIEIALNAALDADGDMTLDACQLDCDGDGVADAVQILSNMALDRSRDGRLDSCEDCDGDGNTDFAELQGSKSRWVASAGDNLIRELDPRSGVLRRSVDAGASPRDLAIGADGRLYIALQNEVRVFDRVTGSAVVPWATNLAGQARAVAVAPNGQMAVLLDTGAIVLLNSSGGFVQNLVGAIPGSLDSRDLVFRTAPGGASEAIVTQGNGLVLRVTWPGGVRSVFCDLTALNPALRGAYAMADGSILVAASALNAVHRIAANGTHLGEWDVDNGALVNGAYAITDAGDGRAVLVTGPNSGSTINGFRLTNGYTERTYRVYPADAPQATALVIAPPSSTDANGNLVPDECELSPADLNGDGIVNGADLSALLGSWGACAGTCAADINDDGSVGAADLAILLNLWGS